MQIVDGFVYRLSAFLIETCLNLLTAFKIGTFAVDF